MVHRLHYYDPSPARLEHTWTLRTAQFIHGNSFLLHVLLATQTQDVLSSTDGYKFSYHRNQLLGIYVRCLMIIILSHS